MNYFSRLVAGLALANGIALCPALAAPDLAVDTKAAEINVEIDAALKKHAGLADNLLAEGRKWTASMRADADKEMRESPEMFRDGRKWSLERSYNSRSVVGRYVSIVRTEYSFTGGAHPNTRFDTILWDAQARKRISIRPFFKETADNGPTMTALAGLVRVAVATDKMERNRSADDDKKSPPPSVENFIKDDQLITDHIQASLLKLGPVTLAPSTEAGKSSGFTVHFSPYDVDSYAAGPYTVFVPWTAFKAHLSDEGVPVFGGARPEADSKEY